MDEREGQMCVRQRIMYRVRDPQSVFHTRAILVDSADTFLEEQNFH